VIDIEKLVMVRGLSLDQCETAEDESFDPLEMDPTPNCMAPPAQLSRRQPMARR